MQQGLGYVRSVIIRYPHARDLKDQMGHAKALLRIVLANVELTTFSMVKVVKSSAGMEKPFFLNSVMMVTKKVEMDVLNIVNMRMDINAKMMPNRFQHAIQKIF